jgi:thioredoxin reductase (NADPH)
MVSLYFILIVSTLSACIGHSSSSSNPSLSTANAEPARDCVIIGSGPSGCTAAIYAGRAFLNPLVVAGYQSGGQLMLTSEVENFPGYQEPITGPEMMQDLTQQARRFGAEFWNTDCTSIDLSSYPYQVKMANCTVSAKSVILSTGAEALWLNAEGEEEFKGKGISTCATCDGYVFREKPVVVVGGGDSAMEEAIFLTRYASAVHVVHRRDTYRASKVMLERATKNPKITFHSNRIVSRWLGDDGILNGVELKITGDPDKAAERLSCDGAFIAIGHRPKTSFLDNQVKLDAEGYILLSENTMTSRTGVFACGDVVDTRYKQAITAAGMGCQAAIDAEKWLQELTAGLQI